MTEPVLPTPDDLRDNRVAARFAAVATTPAPVAAGRSTSALLRDFHAVEADALDRFTEVIAELFSCPGLVSDAGRNKMRGAFADARHLARHFGASGEVAERRAADPTAPGRDASGRFTRAG